MGFWKDYVEKPLDKAVGYVKDVVDPVYNVAKDITHDIVDSDIGKAAIIAAAAYYGLAPSAVTATEVAGAAEAGALTAAEASAGAAAVASPSIMSSLATYATPLAIAGSSLLGAKAAKDAASTQVQATKESNALISKMYEEQKALQQPYVAGGTAAQNRMLTLLGLTGGDTTSAEYGSANKNFAPSDLTTDPSYTFRLNEGLKALDRQAAARGGLISGGAIKAAQEYGQQSASQEYQNAFNRFQTNRSNMLQPLGNLITSGQNAAAGVGTAASNYGNTVSNNIQSGAAATAAGNVGAANAIAGGVSQYLNYNQGNNLAELLLKQRQSAYGAKA